MVAGGERVGWVWRGGAGGGGEDVKAMVGGMGGEVNKEDGLVGVDGWDEGMEACRGVEGSGRRGGLGRVAVVVGVLGTDGEVVGGEFVGWFWEEGYRGCGD